MPNTLAKGFVGAGALSVANLDDHHFFAGYQILRHRQQHQRQRSNLRHDRCGPRLHAARQAQKGDVQPLIGFNYWQEEAEAFGARCNRDDLAGAFCGPPSSIVVPFSTKVITIRRAGRRSGSAPR